VGTSNKPIRTRIFWHPNSDLQIHFSQGQFKQDFLHRNRRKEATMRRIRILLAGMPRMLLDMITDIVALHADIMIAVTMPDMADIVAAVRKTRADVVVLSESAIGPSPDYQELVYSRPHLGVLSITSDGRYFFLHKLRPVRTALGAVSPESLVQAIQSSAQRELG
jgi:hypothetical protein